MSDLNDRLTALDPAAAQPYQHRDLETLITRITAQPQHATRGWWQNLELKLASFLVAGSLVVAGSLAIVEGATSTLPALALAQTHAKFAPSASTTVGAMQVYEQFDFHASSAIAATAPSSPSYPLTVPASGAREATRVAAVFGVSGTPVNTNGDGSDWTVSDPSGASLDYENSGVPQWYYSSSSPAVAPATASDSASVPVPSDATLAGDVTRYLSELGFGYQVASPEFGTSTISETNASGGPVSVSTADVTYDVVVDGVATDQSVNFSVNAQNHVLNASGPALRVGPAANYPLQSPLAGVAALNAAPRAKYAATSSASSSGAGTSSGGSSGSSSGGSSTGTTTAGPPIVSAALTGDTISLATYQLTSGALWFLPVYDYHGEVTGANGTVSSGTWSELAVDPSYVHVGSDSAVVSPSDLKF